MSALFRAAYNGGREMKSFKEAVKDLWWELTRGWHKHAWRNLILFTFLLGMWTGYKMWGN
jgi:hypothetical protein